MKLTVIGGGGVRAPLFVSAALRRAERISLDEICLMDDDGAKLKIFGSLCQELAKAAGSPVRISMTTDPLTALEGASYIVTTIRVGGEQGRILDEKIALRNGVLGQETTGPGGFAMALRSILPILHYAQLADKVCPTTWMFNFTNPAGLVTQALRDQGFARTIGICDSANAAQHAISKTLGVNSKDLRSEVFGLNHLSWTRRVFFQEEDVLPKYLADPDFLSATIQHMFDPALIHQLGMWLNEYLYYYYYAERAVESIRGEKMTRGEEIYELNQNLIDDLNNINIRTQPDKALRRYVAYEHRRSSTYMHYAQPGSLSPQEADQLEKQLIAEPSGEEGEGYAGIALNIIESFQSDQPLYVGLNVPNGSAIVGMFPEDVVEVSCRVDSQGVHTLPIGAIPEGPLNLMRSVKLYERLTVMAILARSRSLAVEALMAHPLVLSYSLASKLVNEYLSAHAAFVGEWI